MMRRKHGTGSITPRNGRPLARLHVALLHVRGRLRALGTFDTHDEAERVLSAAAAKLASPDYVAIGGSTLCEIGERCLDRRELDGLCDVTTDRSRFKCHIADTWLGAMPVKAIAGRDVRLRAAVRDSVGDAVHAHHEGVRSNDSRGTLVREARGQERRTRPGQGRPPWGTPLNNVGGRSRRSRHVAFSSER